MISPLSRLLILALALPLAACSGNSQTAAPRPVVASFQPGATDTVTIDVLDPEAAEQIELLSPDGQVLGAFRIDREKITGSYSGDPSVGVGVGVGSGGCCHDGGVGVGTGIGFGFPLGGGTTTEPKTRSIGQVKVPDMAAYRTQWTKWQARVTFPGSRVVTVAAPPPPVSG
ncbi:MAG TPA: hypothetical protein VH835_04570 [Dongiaceae bacterium]